jgi:hypothetical protein
MRAMNEMKGNEVRGYYNNSRFAILPLGSCGFPSKTITIILIYPGFCLFFVYLNVLLSQDYRSIACKDAMVSEK